MINITKLKAIPAGMVTWVNSVQAAIKEAQGLINNLNQQVTKQLPYQKVLSAGEFRTSLSDPRIRILTGGIYQTDIDGTVVSSWTSAGLNVNGATINGGTVSGVTVTGSTVVGGTVSGVTVTGSTVIGGRVATAPDGARVQLEPTNGSYLNGQLGFYNPDNSLMGAIRVDAGEGMFITVGDPDNGNGSVVYLRYNQALIQVNGSAAASSWVLVDPSFGISLKGAVVQQGGTFSIDYYSLATTGSAANVNVGTLGKFNRSTSSRRYKHDITDLPDPARVLDLRPVRFHHEGEEDRWRFGLIAEEVDEAGLEELVEYDDQDRPDAVHYSNGWPMLIPIVRELWNDYQDRIAR